MYKESIYNYYVSSGDRIIYFNGLTGASVSLSISEHQIIKKAMGDLISFQINYPTLCDKFKQWGFIVDDCLNEIDKIRFNNKCTVFKDRSYHLILNPTLECNFKCWYCYENHKQGVMSEDIINRIKRHIELKTKAEKVSFMFLDWFGGEPLLYFNRIVYPISMFVKEACEKEGIPYHFHLTTNGYLLNKSNIEQINQFDNVRFQITLDGGKNRHDKIRNQDGSPSFDVIISNICLLCEQIDRVEIILRINYTDFTIDNDLEKIFEYIPVNLRHKIIISFNRVWQTTVSKTFVNDDNKLLKIISVCRDLGYNVIHSIPFVVGAKSRCYMDNLNTSLINYDGNVYSCTGRDFVPTNIIGKLMEDGRIELDDNKICMKYGNATFENEACLKCKHLPLCLGPCSQQNVERIQTKSDFKCVYNISDITIDTFIKEYYKSRLKIYEAQD